MKVTNSFLSSQRHEPVIQLVGYLKALDENSTLVAAQILVNWITIEVRVAIPIAALIGLSPYLPFEVVLAVNVCLLLSWLWPVRKLYVDYRSLKSLLYAAMRE